jgi:hypothetical protein
MGYVVFSGRERHHEHHGHALHYGRLSFPSQLWPKAVVGGTAIFATGTMVMGAWNGWPSAGVSNDLEPDLLVNLEALGQLGFARLGHPSSCKASLPRRRACAPDPPSSPRPRAPSAPR